MKSYHNVIGIDIGKFNFVVAVYNNKQTRVNHFLCVSSKIYAPTNLV